MFHPWPILAERFTQTLKEAGQTDCPRITDLRSSSLFFFLNFITGQQRDDRTAGTVLFLTETTQQAARYQQFAADVIRLVEDREPRKEELLVFPDLEPQSLFEYSDPPLEVAEGRSEVLDHLCNSSASVVFSAYKACWRRLPNPEEFQARILLLASHAGEHPDALLSINRDELASQLEDLGYCQVTTVTRMGEYALRGGLVDVFPSGEENPSRIDLFGSEIESIAEFDPENQRTTSQRNLLRITGIGVNRRTIARPEVTGWLEDQWQAYEKSYAPDMSRSALERIREVFESDLVSLAEQTETPRMGWYQRSGANREHCLWHYLPEGSTVLVHEDGFVDSETNSYFRFWENRFGDWLRNGLSFLDLADYFYRPAVPVSETLEAIASGICGVEGPDGGHNLEVPKIKPILTHSFDSAQHGTSRFSVGLDVPSATAHWSTSKLADSVSGFPKIDNTREPYQSLTGRSPGLTPDYDRPVSILTQFSSRMREIMEDSGTKPEVESAILPGGFVILDAGGEPVWTIVTDMEMFGEIAEIAPTQTRKYRRDAIRRTDELSPGDYVVHIDYGIGRFAQLTDREVAGVRKSFVEVEYAERDKLFVPVDQLDRLRKYSFDGSVPSLSHLGRDTWKKTRDKVQRDTLELARKLLSLYKTRMQKPGRAYAPATVWQEEFADGFPYRLTEDQVTAWRDVEHDMESEKAMDRLICGDVGFGKTEIAMRAAFKACVDECQVLILCPTTVLADQHYRTFRSRFKAFPFRIGLLSRFQSTKEQKDTTDKLKTGRLDVLIGTHRAFSKDVEFKTLGLLVVDEEQRFGVKQKEKMKMKWPDTDVLSMSATPIPRTLHMSLIGLRDISMIESAPVARKPVKTYVGEFDELLVREAMLRELGRGGQIYFLHNKVQDIDKTKTMIEGLVPGEKILIGHGQMRENRLEEVMHAFSLGAYRILLATTIIENGLDIPTVNTIIVDQAENLGLAQMHQLRGRVGRSNVQAYAHFFHSPNRVLTEEAQNRLHAIYNYAYLGAGYEIAQSDLRIRGAGNLLGAAQSGLAKQVGFEYYCELLARSISDVKALDEANIEEWEDSPVISERPGTQLDLPIPAFIPDGYVSDPVLRLELLRDIAGLASIEEVDAFSAELIDRFGKLPTEVSNLLLVSLVKISATNAGMEQLSYNRIQELFQFRFFDDEHDWYKRAPLLDSRFTKSYQNTLELELPFTGPETGTELIEVIDGLINLKSGG